MPAPMPEREFNRMVKNAGFFIEQFGKEPRIVDSKGCFLMSYGVRHKKGARREVSAAYVQRSRKILRGLNE